MVKKLLTALLVFGILFQIFIVPVFAVEEVDSTVLVSKNAYEIDGKTGEYKVELKVPGRDGTELHDEVILMVDGSYSMDEEWPAMKEAILEIGKSFLNGNGNTQLTLMAFGMGDNEVLTHVQSVSELENYLGELPGTLLYGRSSTNCEAGFTGVAEYIDQHDDTLNDVHVIFISDGNINTDETPYTFYHWKENTWLRWSPIKIAKMTLGYEVESILDGGTASAAFVTVFGENVDVTSVMDTVTDEQAMSWIDLVWDAVYESAGFKKDEAYPVSDVERAFVAYDEENGTYIQDVFYYALIGRSYPNRWTRTPEAGNVLANKEEVKSLYMVDYDSYTSWMDTGIIAENSQFIQSDGIDGLVEALKEVITNLSKTSFNDVVVTDYMSKWVQLDTTSIAIVDDATNTVIYTTKDGWLIEKGQRPTSKEIPITVELVSENVYQNGGEDVVGNTNGDIYKLTWYVKDGTLLRHENYHLEYYVTMDTKEYQFQYDTKYPTNGKTTVTYIDSDDNEKVEDIEVPMGMVSTPEKGVLTFASGTVSHVVYFYVDSNGQVEYVRKLNVGGKSTSVELPYREGYTLAVFIKQAQSGMIWTSKEVSEEVSERIVNAVVQYDKAYKGHDAVVFGNGDHTLTYHIGNKSKTKTVIYHFS